ncbi:MAG: hypothetical protein ACWGMZ_06080, partial [Thermoguttaceae bacterium]
EILDQIFMAAAPYANLVRRGIDRQQELIDQDTAEQEAAEDAWKQRFIARYGRILGAKAQRELEKLAAAAAKQGAHAPKNEPPKSDEDNKTSPSQKQNKQPDQATAAAEQQRKLKETLQLGVSYAPKVEKLAYDAASLLEEDKQPEALPKQKEALKLLKEMLPKEQQKKQDKKDQKKNDQNKKDQNKNKQQQKSGKQDKNKQDQKKQQQKKQDQQQQKSQSQKQKDQEKKKQQKTQAQKRRDQSKQQAQAVLNRARQRREKYKEAKKALQEYLYQPAEVDKDW